MVNIRLKKGQVDPKNPHATSVRGAVKLNTADINSVDIKSSREPAYVLKRVNYHYSCPTCKTPFVPVKTNEEMDAQVKAHDCENLTNEEAYRHRKVVKDEIGMYAYMDKLEFKPDHAQCSSYQTACVDCAEKHELKLYELFTFDEMSSIVRPDSMFYNPNRKKYFGDNNEYINFGAVLDFPASQAWQYLPDKSGMQLELERKGINFSTHLDDDDVCRICGEHVYDMYCMECFTGNGYLIERDED